VRRAARFTGGGAALLAFACSVYETPNEHDATNGNPIGTAGVAAVAGLGAEAGSGAQSNGAGPSVGGASGGVGGSSAAQAGSSAGTLLGGSSAGGEPEPAGGGEGGAPPLADDCPNDPNKVEPGECGCGVPDAPSATLADCRTLESLLIHRYDFEGSGTSVKDRVGIAHGVVARGATLSKLDGKGVVLLGGGDVGAYVDLPNGLLSSLKNATLEAWVTWGGGTSWQRIFDFGDSTAAVPEDNQANGKTYLFVTPKSGSGVVALAYSLGGVAQEVDVNGAAVLAQTLRQVVAVANDDGDKLVLYVDGAKVAEQVWTGQLSKINDVNVWLGRSQYAYDSELNAVYHEFRVYGAALSAAQVAATFAAGTDPSFLAY
jgi:hypothetical protein